MLMFNLIEHSNNYQKTSGSLWQYCKDIPVVNNNGEIVDLVRITLLIHFILNKK